MINDKVKGLLEEIDKSDMTYEERIKLYSEIRSVIIDRMISEIKNHKMDTMIKPRMQPEIKEETQNSKEAVSTFLKLLKERSAQIKLEESIAFEDEDFSMEEEVLEDEMEPIEEIFAIEEGMFTEEDEMAIEKYVAFFHSHNIEDPYTLIDHVGPEASDEAKKHEKLLLEAARRVKQTEYNR